MALIKCPDCGREVSDLAAACPRCARPIREAEPSPTASTAPASSARPWRKLTLLGAILLVAGFAAGGLAAPGGNVVKMGSVFFVVGVIALLIGFIGGWWHQD